MDPKQTPAPQPGNGSSKPRSRRLPNIHAPGQPYGEAVKELWSLAGIARLLVSGMGGAATKADCSETAEHLAARLDALASRLANLELQPGRRHAKSVTPGSGRST